MSKVVSMLKLREALEASWKADTAYLHVHQVGNPALGNCYSTSRVVQHFFPKVEIVEGQVWTGKQTEKHFWNVLISEDDEYHIDLTWQQFRHGSVVKEYKLRDRATLNDTDSTQKRIELLLERVNEFMSQN